VDQGNARVDVGQRELPCPDHLVEDLPQDLLDDHHMLAERADGVRRQQGVQLGTDAEAELSRHAEVVSDVGREALGRGGGREGVPQPGRVRGRSHRTPTQPAPTPCRRSGCRALTVRTRR
jgi:hypothetical protein